MYRSWFSISILLVYLGSCGTPPAESTADANAPSEYEDDDLPPLPPDLPPFVSDFIWDTNALSWEGAGCTGVSVLAIGNELALALPQLGVDLTLPGGNLLGESRCTLHVPVVVSGPVKNAELVERMTYSLSKTRDSTASLHHTSTFALTASTPLELAWPNYAIEAIVAEGATNRTSLVGPYPDVCAFCWSNGITAGTYSVSITLDANRGNTSAASVLSSVPALSVVYQTTETVPSDCSLCLEPPDGDDDPDDLDSDSTPPSADSHSGP